MTALTRHQLDGSMNGYDSVSARREGRDRARQPVLIILHQRESNPGAIGRALRDKGYALDIRRPRYGDPLPETLSEHAGAVVFGGPMSANDSDDFMRREIDWLAVPLREEKPFLGVCLGAQMLVKHLGGDVDYHRDDQVEIGYYPLEPTRVGAELLNWPSHVYQWHTEGFSLPSGTRLLAAGSAFPNQAISVGPAAFGFQFHPEITLALVYRWTTRAAYRLVLPGAKERSTHFAGHISHGGEVQSWLSRFLDTWLSRSALSMQAGALGSVEG